MGALAYLGIHKTDLIHFLTGRYIVSVMAKITTLDKRDGSGNLISVDDNAFCVYTLSGGATGTMTASWTFNGSEDNSTVLYGTKGILRVYDLYSDHSIRVETAEGTALYDIDRIQTNDSQTKSGVIDHFVQCVEENRQPEISGREALHAMRAVFAGLEASEKGCSVTVDQDF